MKIQVIANCQARPISALLPQIASDIETLEPIILHLAKPQDCERDLAQVSQADFIFAQLTQDNFQASHLASKFLKDRFGEKVIIWPNIFYMGQQPYLRYFSHKTEGRMIGPMDAMHDLRLYKSWRDTGRVNPSAALEYEPDFIYAAREASLSELRAKESVCDVSISDFLSSFEDRERLFFTFNHPTQLVLTEMARRIFSKLGLTPKNLNSNTPQVEPLGRYRVPSLWSEAADYCQGDKIVMDSDDGPQRLPGKPEIYNLEALCEVYQKVYDSHDAYKTLSDIRLTPATQLDEAVLKRC
jgi:hypothetical protein